MGEQDPDEDTGRGDELTGHIGPRQARGVVPLEDHAGDEPDEGLRRFLRLRVAEDDRKGELAVPVPQMDGPPVCIGARRASKRRFLHAKEVAQSPGGILEDFEEGTEGLMLGEVNSEAYIAF